MKNKLILTFLLTPSLAFSQAAPTFGGYGGNDIGAIVSWTFVIIVALVVMRIFLTWYFKLSEISDTLKGIKKELEAARSADNPLTRAEAQTSQMLAQEKLEKKFWWERFVK